MDDRDTNVTFTEISLNKDLLALVNRILDQNQQLIEQNNRILETNHAMLRIFEIPKPLYGEPKSGIVADFFRKR